MKNKKKALVSFAIAGFAVTMIPFNALAADTVSTRLAGNTAVQTAQAISQDYLTSSEYAVVAPAMAYNMVDALAAAPLAAALKAPVLLNSGDQLSPEAKSEIKRLGVKTVYVTSGLAVIKAGVIDDLQGMGVNVTNLGGFDQYETSVNIAKVIANISPTTSVFIANGETAHVAQDALSIASVAGAQKQPLLLTKKGQLPQVVADYLNNIKANVTASYITGGTGVVSDAVQAQLPGTVYRNAGFDAYDTNLEVLKNFLNFSYDRVFIASGETMIDALAGAPLAASVNAPVVLVNKTLRSVTADFLKKTKIKSNTVVTALGGLAVVPESLRKGMVPMPIGGDRVDPGNGPFKSSYPVIGSTSAYDLSDYIKKEDLKTSNGSPVYFETSDENSVYVEGVDGTIIGEIKAAVTEGNMAVTLDKDNITVTPNESHVDGKIILTLNKLNGGVDSNAANQTFRSERTGKDVNIPGNSTYVGSITINVSDLSE